MPSYDFSPRMLINHYNFDAGTSGLIIQTESRKEILTDKILALGLRLDRIKNRDLWDIVWLKRQGIDPDKTMLLKKLENYNVSYSDYREKMISRVESLNSTRIHQDFKTELSRFLPNRIVKDSVESDDFWTFLKSMVTETWENIDQEHKQKPFFSM